MFVRIDSSAKHSTSEFCSKNLEQNCSENFGQMYIIWCWNFCIKLCFEKKKSNSCKICNSSILGSEIFDRFVDQTFGSKWLVQKFFVKKISAKAEMISLEQFDDDVFLFFKSHYCFEIVFNVFHFICVFCNFYIDCSYNFSVW